MLPVGALPIFAVSPNIQPRSSLPIAELVFFLGLHQICKKYPCPVRKTSSQSIFGAFEAALPAQDHTPFAMAGTPPVWKCVWEASG
jgi:hypothetical protein